jgi:hypothetical protein
LIGVWNGQSLKVYYNGNLVGSQSYTGRVGITTQPVSIGSIITTQFPFEGLIDEVRIYNRALSDSEIKSLYEATR